MTQVRGLLETPPVEQMPVGLPSTKGTFLPAQKVQLSHTPHSADQVMARPVLSTKSAQGLLDQLQQLNTQLQHDLPACAPFVQY
jgi:hypothetical protein